MDNYEKFYGEQIKFSLFMTIIVEIVVFLLWIFWVVEF